jgi:hypothetical protein
VGWCLKQISLRFPKRRRKFHRTPACENRDLPVWYGFFHQSTALITTTSFLILENVVVNCCWFVACEKCRGSYGNRGSQQKFLREAHFHRLFRVVGLYNLAKNEYSTLDG